MKKIQQSKCVTFLWMDPKSVCFANNKKIHYIWMSVSGKKPLHLHAFFDLWSSKNKMNHTDGIPIFTLQCTIENRDDSIFLFFLRIFVCVWWWNRRAGCHAKRAMHITVLKKNNSLFHKIIIICFVASQNTPESFFF